MRTAATRAGVLIQAPRWSGFAVRELLLVLFAISLAIAGVTAVDPTDHAASNVTPVTGTDILIGHEVPLGDEFVCTVGLISYTAPDSKGEPYYVCRARFARRHLNRVGEFLFDLTTGGSCSRRLTCGRVWTLMNLTETEAYLRDHHGYTRSPEVTDDERLWAIHQKDAWEVETVTALDETLRRCMPRDLRDTGLLVLTDEPDLMKLHELNSFPLTRLAAAIRIAAERDDWTKTSSRELLPQERRGGRALTTEEQHALAQSLVRRLLRYLPREESAYAAHGGF